MAYGKAGAHYVDDVQSEAKMLISQQPGSKGEKRPRSHSVFEGLITNDLKMPTLPHPLKSVLPSCSSKLGAGLHTGR